MIGWLKEARRPIVNLEYRVMKRHRILLVGLALLLASLARADEPKAPNPQSLGLIEAITDKCAEIDPDNVARYRAQVKMLTQDASDEAVAKVRKSDDYRQAYDSVADSLAATTGKDAVQACKGSLAPSH
jgi:hypothetical protein